MKLLPRDERIEQLERKRRTKGLTPPETNELEQLSAECLMETLKREEAEQIENRMEP